jgi:hypothetical protein
VNLVLTENLLKLCHNGEPEQIDIGRGGVSGLQTFYRLCNRPNDLKQFDKVQFELDYLSSVTQSLLFALASRWWVKGKLAHRNINA